MKNCSEDFGNMDNYDNGPKKNQKRSKKSSSFQHRDHPNKSYSQWIPTQHIPIFGDLDGKKHMRFAKKIPPFGMLKETAEKNHLPTTIWVEKIVKISG